MFLHVIFSIWSYINAVLMLWLGLGSKNTLLSLHKGRTRNGKTTGGVRTRTRSRFSLKYPVRSQQTQVKNVPASCGFTPPNVRTPPQTAASGLTPLSPCYSGSFDWSLALIAETLRLPWNILRLSRRLMPYFIIIVSNHTRAVSLWRWCFIIHSVKTWIWLFLVKQTSSNGFCVITSSVFVPCDYRAPFSFQSEMDETIN